MSFRALALAISCVAGLLGTASFAPVREPADAVRADVLVVGATPAGLAAALAADRRGLRVLLVSRRATLGGVISDAMMDQWDLNTGPHGRSIQSGIFREMHRSLGDAFSPRSAQRAFEAMIAREPRITVLRRWTPIRVHSQTLDGVRRVLDVRFVDPAGGMHTAIAPVIVDATDDGDVAALAGARYDLGRQDAGRDTKMQAATLMFTVRGVDWIAVRRSYTRHRFGPGGSSAARAWGYLPLMLAYRPRSPRVMVRDLNLGRMTDGAVTINAVDVFNVDGRIPSSVARARTIAKAEAPLLLDYLRGRIPGFRAARVASFAPELYVRETRHIYGLALLQAGDIWRGVIPPDAIGLASYPLDVHPVAPDDGPTYATVRHVYGIPFGALVPRGFTNLLAASPAISATHLASGSARIVPTTVEEGEAAGAACALALRERRDFPQIARDRMPSLRRDLVARGARLTIDDVAARYRVRRADGRGVNSRDTT